MPTRRRTLSRVLAASTVLVVAVLAQELRSLGYIQ